MMTRKVALWATTALAGAMLMSTAAYAQQTTGGIRGTVVNEAGAPVEGATVTVTHEPSGTQVQTMTGADGTYSVRNLRVGGPYRIEVTASGTSPETTSIGAIGIGDPSVADVTLFAAGTVSEVTVVGRRGTTQTGPRDRMDAGDINTQASLNRDLKDFARKSPYVLLDPTNNNALVIGGQNNRSNSITIDGVKQTDDFGLNANGYPTQSSPISLSVVQALTVEVAPFDVQYGSFQGGTVNVVTKSGGNEFHGEAFYEKFDNDLRGTKYRAHNTLTGIPFTARVSSEFENKTWGVTFSGPIIKDKLFFLASYEKNETIQPFLFGPTGSGATNEIQGVTPAQVTQVQNILKTVYGYDPLGYTASGLGTEDEKKFIKLDWNINDDHRAVVSWQKTVGAALNQTGNSTSASTPSLALLSKFYTLTTDLEVWKGQVFSNWTPNLSTELSYSHKKVVNVSEPLAGDDFAEFRVYVSGNPNITCNTTTNVCPSIFLGPDISRQANALENTSNLWKFKADYRLGSHSITAGYERESLDIFNLFVQRANGQYQFNSITDLQNRVATVLQYSNAATNNKEDGAAEFSYTTNTAYIQDEWQVMPELTVRAGVRYDWYDASDRPQENAAFEAAYGFKNTGNLDGIGVWQPRFGFNYRPTDRLTVYGGVGLFQGGTPNVWISNNFSNPGNLTGFVSCNSSQAVSATNCPGGMISSLTNVNGFVVGATAQAANTASANAGTGNINALSPGFETASIWKASLGVTYDLDLSNLHFADLNFGDNWRLRAEYLYSNVNEALNWVDVYQERFRNATPAPDGRPTFGTVATSGPATAFGSASRLNRTDVVFVNTSEGEGKQWVVGLSHDWTDGMWEGLSLDISHMVQDITDVSPGTSSVATSNYRQVAISDPNDMHAARSNYEIAYATKFSLGYERKFFGDWTTRLGLFAQRRAGLPFSYVFDDASTTGARTGMFGENSLYTSTDRQLLYVPATDSSGNVTATSDPRVTYAAGFNVADFNRFLHQTGLISYAGRISPRNAFRSRDVTTVDLHFGQEIPAFFPEGARGEVYFDIINFGNMLNNSWGVIQQQGFPYMNAAVVARNCQATFQTCTAGTGNFYQYDSFTRRSQTSFDNQSVWQVKLGVRYRF
jgi:hypothetical protein